MTFPQAEFITSAPTIKHCPEWDLAEVAIVGRSNVGKSSFVNTLTGRKKLAQTSNTPGKTRLMNFYRINEKFAFVDLPGYGYAKVSKTMQAQWQKNFQVYLTKRSNLALVIQLIDIRHGPQESDAAMLAWLEERELPTVLVLTKADKISRNQLKAKIDESAKRLDLSADQMFAFSSETGWGKTEFLSFLKEYLDENPSRID